MYGETYNCSYFLTMFYHDTLVPSDRYNIDTTPELSMRYILNYVIYYCV